MTTPKTVDSLKIELLVDNHIEWMTEMPPCFAGEVRAQMMRGPPIDTELTGLPFVDFENYIERKLTNDLQSCCGAHGLSFLITTTLGDESHTILFDAGPESKSIARNLKALKIDATKIERIALSHWHADHSGGILTALETIKSAKDLKGETGTSVPVDLHPNRPIARGIAPPPAFKPMARLPADPSFEEMKARGGEPDLHDEPHTVSNDQVWISGEIPRTTDFEDGLIGSIQYIGGKWETDPSITDERFVVVDVKNKGLVIFSSCSHAGIINVLRAARDAFPERPIHMVLGGFHLAGPELKYRLEPTVNAMVEFNPDFVVPLHCTGFNAKVLLREKLGAKVVPGGVGMVISA